MSPRRPPTPPTVRIRSGRLPMLTNPTTLYRRASARHIHPLERRKSFVRVVARIQLFATRQYDFLVLAHSHALPSDVPSLRSALYRIETFFHCFQ